MTARRLPEDHGLAALGLVMQLGGTLLAAGMALFTFGSVFDGPFDFADQLWLFILMATCVGRSLSHRAAGIELLYGRRVDAMVDASGTNPLMGVRRYVIVGILHSLAFVALVKIRFDIPPRVMLGLGLGLAAWPAILGLLFYSDVFAPLIAQPRLPVSEDKGFEGASILMTVFGACGVLAMGTFVIVMFEGGPPSARQLLGMIAMIVLLARSILHVQAGLSGLRTTSIERSVALANRYANFGLISSYATAGVILLTSFSTDTRGSQLAAIVALWAVLAAWPYIVRRFFVDRQFIELLGKKDQHRRAPDIGLTALGWLLLAFAAFNASMLIPQLVGGELPAWLGKLYQVFGSSPGRSLWWNVGVAMLEAWAGFELVRMSPHYRAVAIVYAVVSAGVTVYLALPVISIVNQLDHLIHLPKVLVLLPVAVSLVIPITTFVLVNREVTPTARARYRT